jgi:FkbM family methyltransferase
MNGLTSLVRRVTASTRLQRRRHPPTVQNQFAGPRLLRAFGQCFPRAVFVEIGANDGQQHDHLRALILEHEWRGVMVEPVPYVFARLQQNYRAIDRVSLENAAIADRNARMPFYHLAEVSDHARAGLPQWYDGIGSFSRAAVLDHGRLIPDIAQRLVDTEVPCLTFHSLCAKHGIASIDLLVIDTEGYDYEVLRRVDFSTYRPVLVVYEHYHLAAGDRQASRERMRQAGYEVMVEGFDTWCLRLDADERLAATWRRLHPVVPEVVVENEPR